MFSFISLNTRGLKNNVKRKAIFLFCKEQKAKCVFLQETHSVEEDVNFWKLQWGDSIYVSHGTSHSAGVMILLNKFPGKVINHFGDTYGHWLILIFEFNGEMFILVCVYGYNERAKNKTLLSDLCKQILDLKHAHLTENVIVGGDFNLAPDLWLDRHPPRAQCHKFDDLVVEFMNVVNLVDYWRILNPVTRQYTWFNAAGNGQSSRLDYWLISSSLVKYIDKCSISASPLTDHCVVSLSLQCNKSVTDLIQIWKFNNMLLEDSCFCNKVRELITEVNVLDMSPVSKWEWFKFKIRSLAIEFSKSALRLKRLKQQNILRNINDLCKKMDLSTEELLELNKLQSELDILYIEKAKGAFVRSRARWIEEGEKNTTYFFNLEKQRQLKKQINKLSVNNFVYEDQREINKEIHTFYSNLYKSYHSEADCEILFESIEGLNQNIDLEFKHFMENDLDIEEMDAAVLKMSSGKSPGLDGLTAEFYKFFWTDIRRLLHEAFLECISAGSLSNTMRQGLITLIPKPNKNTLYLDNWRPITLLCNDYKILAHVFAERLNRGLKDLVDECQSAFIKGRNIHNHIRLVVDLLDYCDFVDPDSLILFLDFYKAFDTLEHSFLIKALKFLGFGDKFCNIIKMFYNDIYSSVSLNPGITPRFVIKRGIRQGCPISPKLFILATQLLTILIKHSHDIQGISIFEKQYKISQFADDTALLLKDDAEVVKALNRIQLFSKASGLKLNISKCEILPVHSCQHQTIEAIRVVHEVKYLGVLLSKNTLRREEVNITNRLFDMKKSLSRWLTRDLTVFGRNLLTKAEGVSKIIYPCYSLYISPPNIRKVNSIIFQFIWKNKTHYIKRSQLVKSYDNGGINALDFEAMVGTFRINFLKALLVDSDSMWFHIPRSIFKHLGGIDFLLKCDFEVNKIPFILSNFHKQVLQFWKMIFNHNFTPHGSTLWNNRTVIVGRKSLFKQDWFDRNILFVTDLTDSDGNLLTFSSFIDKYSLTCSLKEFKKVCRAIPAALIHLIKNTVFTPLRTIISLPKLQINGCNFLDFKLNNNLLNNCLKERIYHVHNRASFRSFSFFNSQSLLVKAHSKYIKWPVLPKVKETHFKIINKYYPVSDFLQSRFKFDVESCIFCNSNEETLEHLFFSCDYSKEFWTQIRNWINLKLNIPPFGISDVMLFMENIDDSFSNFINIILLLGKYHIHCCKWRGSKPSFPGFINDFKLYYSSLKRLQSSVGVKKISKQISLWLLF
uniref:Reverse transcriptase domain-containing protein n=1 Tax=Oryzias latipes TaxID=8090 RepID=A0A3P9JF49_ORYLA